jgi:DHA1 family bicyclomycin/chloramphenicol resistance-like MFS transporter
MGLIALLLVVAVIGLLPETKRPDAAVSLNIKNIWPEYIAVFKQPAFMAYSIAGGISYAGMYAYIAGSPFVFMQKFGFSDLQYGWAFAFNACGLILGSQLNHFFLKRRGSAALTFRATVFLFIVGLSLLLTTITGIAGAALTLCFTFLFLCCVGIINPNTTALALEPFTAAAGRAAAVLGSLQMIAGVLASWLVSALDNGTTVIMPAVMFGCTVLPLLLLLFFSPSPAQCPV